MNRVKFPYKRYKECISIPTYTPIPLCKNQVSNHITLTGNFESTDLISPKISDEFFPTVEAMIWFCLHPEPQVGHSLPIPMDFAPKKAWESLEPHFLHRTQILCILYLRHCDSLEVVYRLAYFELV